MKASDVRKCRYLHKHQYTIEQISLVVGITVGQVEYALSQQSRKGQPEKRLGEDVLIDGERLEDRIERMKAEIRYGKMEKRSGTY